MSNLLIVAIEVYIKYNGCTVLKIMTQRLFREGFAREVTFELGLEGQVGFFQMEERQKDILLG